MCELETPEILKLASISHNCPSARCAPARNAISIDVGVFGEKSILINDLLI